MTTNAWLIGQIKLANQPISVGSGVVSANTVVASRRDSN
jgi:hypothetical protein